MGADREYLDTRAAGHTEIRRQTASPNSSMSGDFANWEREREGAVRGQSWRRDKKNHKNGRYGR